MSLCYSVNEEDYHNHIEDAVECGNFEVGQVVTIYEADRVGFDIGVFVPDADWLLERMSEAAYEEGGEYADGWLSDVSSDQKKQLEDVVALAVEMWATANKMHPHFFRAENPRLIYVRVTDEGHERLSD